MGNSSTACIHAPCGAFYASELQAKERVPLHRYCLGLQVRHERIARIEKIFPRVASGVQGEDLCGFAGAIRQQASIWQCLTAKHMVKIR